MVRQNWSNYEKKPLFFSHRHAHLCLAFTIDSSNGCCTDPQLKALQLGCFRYFQRGGNCIDGPVGLLAGIIRQPLVLVYHFFAVALYAIWIRFMAIASPTTIKPTSFPPSASASSISLAGTAWWSLPAFLLDSVFVLWKACLVLFPYVWSELQR